MFHGGQAKHLLKDCATMRGYICNMLDQQGKALKLAHKADDPADAAQGEDTEFTEAKCFLMIFGGSRVYESRW
jgi:hypothetical protein